MIKKEEIEKILNKINKSYFSINLIKNDNQTSVIKDKIEEPILSSSFTTYVKEIYPSYECFSEFIILNKFDIELIKKDLKISKNDERVLRSNKWELDSLIYDNDSCSLLEFKYYKYSLSDLLRLIIIMSKISKIKSIYIIYHTEQHLSKNDAIINFINLNITDELFEKTLKYLNDENNEFNCFEELKSKLDIKIKNSNIDKCNWICVKINNNNNFEFNKKKLWEKNNFKKIESFTKLVNKKINWIDNKIFNNSEKIDKFFLENDFEKFGNKKWTSLFRSNVLKNFFKHKNKLCENEIKWIIEFVEKIIFQQKEYKKIDQIGQLLNINEWISNNEYEKINKKISEFHCRWSNLFSINKKIKQNDINIKKYSLDQDNTTISIQQNQVTKIIKKTIFEFIERNKFFNISNEFKKCFDQEEIDIKKITKEYSNLNELATNALFILYFFAKLNFYNKEIFDDLSNEEQEKTKQSISYFSLIKNNENVEIINYAFYLNCISKNEKNNIFEYLTKDILSTK